VRKVLVRARYREWGQPEGVLGGKPEPFAAGGQDVQVGAAGQDDLDGVTDRVEQMLTVVDHEEVGAVAQDGDAGREHIAPHDVQVQRRGQRVRDGSGIGDRREQQHGRRLDASRDLQRDPGLAHPAGPDERDQPFVREQPMQRRHLVLTPDQPGRRPRWRLGSGGRRTGGASGDVALELAQRR
jgi:hypothetical protein